MKHSIQKNILQPNAGEELLVCPGKRKSLEINEASANLGMSYLKENFAG